MTIDPTITTGNVISIVATVVTVGLGTVKIVTRISKMEVKLDLVWKWFEREHKMNGKK